MAKATHYRSKGVNSFGEYDCIVCGIPSPGSRAQGYQGGSHLRPATEDSVDSSTNPKQVDCKRCRRTPQFKYALKQLANVR